MVFDYFGVLVMVTEVARTSGPSRPPRFHRTLADLLDRVTYGRARLHDPDDPVYKLRYQAYNRAGYVAESPEQSLRDQFDYAPNAYCYGVRIDEQMVSSVRFQLVTPEQRSSLSRTIWPDVLDPILDAGDSFIDPSRLTADHDASLAFPALPFLTLRIITMAMEYFDPRYCLHAVTPGHGSFYERIFGSEPRGEPRSYGGLKSPVTVALYLVESETARRSASERFPIFLSTPEEREALFGGSGDEVYERRVVPSAFDAYRGRYGKAVSAA
jgi:N-acyl amino acid synthase FeeM